MNQSLDDRRKGYESKWAHDEETRFKIQARRDYQLGLWAAGLKGLSGEAADAFASSVVAADMAEPGDEDVFRMLRAELEAGISDAVIRGKMRDLLEAVSEQVAKDLK